MQNGRHSCHIWTQLEFSGQIVQKYSNISFMEIRPDGGEMFHGAGRTGGHTWRNY